MIHLFKYIGECQGVSLMYKKQDMTPYTQVDLRCVYARVCVYSYTNTYASYNAAYMYITESFSTRALVTSGPGNFWL